MNSDWILYGTYGCHLCDQARELLLGIDDPPLRFDEVDILDDAELEQRLGVRIPVLRHVASGQELGWPFDQQQVIEFRSHVEVAP